MARFMFVASGLFCAAGAVLMLRAECVYEWRYYQRSIAGICTLVFIGLAGLFFLLAAKTRY